MFERPAGRLETLRLLGRCRRAERAGYVTLADVIGDTTRSVDYAGMLFGRLPGRQRLGRRRP
jgi:hypothetical protein